MLLFNIDQNKVQGFMSTLDTQLDGCVKAKQVQYNFDFMDSVPTSPFSTKSSTSNAANDFGGMVTG